jgi:hypothetical protein
MSTNAVTAGNTWISAANSAYSNFGWQGSSTEK